MMVRRTGRRRAAFAVWLVFSIAYIGWRAAFSLNPDAFAYSVVFLGLETYALVCASLFYWVVLERAPPRAPLAGREYSVDVLICTYNEAIPLVRQTVRRAQALSYPHRTGVRQGVRGSSPEKPEGRTNPGGSANARTWLLDDGNRPEARALAEELGCRYLARGENTHYKAGNLNHALKHVTGELIVVLDADHLLRPGFLTRLVGYFDDPKVALVQTPQVFHNIDSFQHHFRPARRQLWHEGAIFHHAMQPGAERWNAGFFVGTGAILRRSAVESIGGFATESITEDVFTSMRLHAGGWRTVYHDEALGYLLAPESLLQYLTQRLRWGQGSMQILRKENPLTRRGLGFRQRIAYFNALSSFAQSAVHLAYYLAPGIFLLGGPAPLRAERVIDFLPLLAHIALDVVMFKAMLGPLARPILAECYKFLNFYAFLKALSGYFRSGRLKFQVTTKGRDGAASLKLLLPQILLLALNLAAFGWGILRLLTATNDPIALVGISIAVGFAGLFVLVGSMALLFAWERISTSAEYTFPDQIPARVLDVRGADGFVKVLRANETELHFVWNARATAGAPIELALELASDEAPLLVSGRVTDVQPADGRHVVRVALDRLSVEATDRLSDRFARVAMPRMLDGLMASWGMIYTEPAVDDDTGSGSYYLPMEPNVL